MAQIVRNPNIIPVGEFEETPRYFTHEKKTEYKGTEQVVKDGKKVWLIYVVSGASLFKVSVPLADEPLVPSLTPLKFKNLVCGVYKGNLWFRADDVDLAENDG